MLGVYPDSEYWEPFVGAAYVVAKIDPDRKRTASDLNPDLIQLYHAMQKGWRPPARVEEIEWKAAKEEYKEGGVRSPWHTFVGYGASFSGYFFSTFAKDNQGTNYGAAAANSLTKRWTEGRLDEVEFLQADYRKAPIPDGSVVYCDPPYEGTAKQRAWDERLDQKEFWDWARWMKEDRGCIIYVGTYDIPKGWKPVLDISKRVNFNSHGSSHWQPEYIIRPLHPGEEN